MLAERRGLEVRWLEPRGGEDAGSDTLAPEQVAGLLDQRTRLVAMGLASNATGRVHTSTYTRVREEGARLERRPLLVLDLTHWVPHRRASLHDLGADALVCSAYKFCGPHLGLMALRGDRVRGLVPSKAGLRWEGGRRDLLDYGEFPSTENCQISRWELGTLNYEALAGLEACVDYLASLGPEQGLEAGLAAVQKHEERLSERFLARLSPLLEAGRLRMFGSREPRERTPTFALAVGEGRRERELVEGLTDRGVHCSHGNHYAPGLVEQGLGLEAVTRVSFMHYNTLEEVDRVADILEQITE